MEPSSQMQGMRQQLMHAEVAEERFSASPKSPLRTNRLTLRLTLTALLLLLVLKLRGHPQLLAPLAGVILSILLYAELAMRRQLGKGKPLVTLDRESIASPRFQGKSQRVDWGEIDQVTVRMRRGGAFLELQLKPDAGTAGSGILPWSQPCAGRVALPLAAFDNADRERLLDAIHCRLDATGQMPAVARIRTNQFAAERQFAEKLHALSPRPWMTHALIAANVVIWLLSLRSGGGIAQTPASTLFALGGNAASAVQQGEWWRLLSAIFLHASLMHVTMNMLGLYTAGVTVERIYGARAYLLIYLASGLLGSALSLHFAAQHVVSVGASGAVFGVTGAMLVAVGKNREQIPETLSKRLIVQLAVFIAYALLQGFSRQGIDNAAHIGGLIGGSALAWLLPARLDMSRYQRTAAVSLLAGLALGTLSIAALAMLAPKAALDQRAALASEDHMKHGLLEFVRILKSVQADEQALRAGTLSTNAIAERERNQYIPALRQIDTELSGVKLRPGDPRQPLVADITRGTELMIEAMSLDAANDSGNRQPKPADQAHLASLRAQLREIGEQIRQETAEIRKRARR